MQSANGLLGEMESSPVRVTILYETLEAGLRARALMNCVQAGMDLPPRFLFEYSRFDWLNERSLRNVALSTANRSSLVVISISSKNPLPAPMDGWINDWVESGVGEASAIILLLPGLKTGDYRAHPAHDRVQRTARKKGVDFFCEVFEPAAERTVSGFTGPEGSFSPAAQPSRKCGPPRTKKTDSFIRSNLFWIPHRAVPGVV